MGIFHITLILAALLCSLVAGFLFAFAIVVMPGISRLSDREFIRTFQLMDRVIQNNHPIFMLVWIGSVLVLIVSAVMGIAEFGGAGRMLIIIASLVYILGVQLPTVTINVPLNNQLKNLVVDAMNETTQKDARKQFESRWVRWNSIRTAFACLTSVLLLIMLLML